MKTRTTTPARRAAPSRQLLVIDNAPLQQDAWKRLRLAQKRLEKAARDLHRHENVDAPAFRHWLETTFPQMLSQLRELSFQVTAKAHLVEEVERESFFTGRSCREIWLRRQRQDAAKKEGRETADAEAEESESSGWDEAGREGFDDLEDFLRAHGLDPDLDGDAALGDAAGLRSRSGSGEDHSVAKQIYRRLVQRLHPDSGGHWTDARKALWHQVQQAWEARDADWLARLDAELELAEETLHPSSPLGRLLGALEEIDAARRNTERTLKTYRLSPDWRFAARAPSAADLRRHHGVLRSELQMLQADLSQLEKTLQSWSRPRRRNASPRRSRSLEMQRDVW